MAATNPIRSDSQRGLSRAPVLGGARRPPQAPARGTSHADMQEEAQIRRLPLSQTRALPTQWLVPLSLVRRAQRRAASSASLMLRLVGPPCPVLCCLFSKARLRQGRVGMISVVAGGVQARRVQTGRRHPERGCAGEPRWPPIDMRVVARRVEGVRHQLPGITPPDQQNQRSYPAPQLAAGRRSHEPVAPTERRGEVRRPGGSKTLEGGTRTVADACLSTCPLHHSTIQSGAANGCGWSILSRGH